MPTLSDFFNTNSFNAALMPGFVNRPVQLPNGGGTYQSPVVAQPKAPTKTTATKAPVFASSTPIVLPPAQGTSAPSDVPAEYINPNGGYYTAKEVVANRLAKINAPVSAIPKFAGDTLTEQPQTVEQLTSTAAGLNNARNDIATGETDPYKAGKDSGVAYSPAELKAIEKAYAGVYDPAINTALAKLDTKQKADAAALNAKTRRDEIVFNTNENIRQWRATTGSKGGGGNETFTPTQLHKGASVAGLEMDSFDLLDGDVKNFFINPPKGTDPVTGKLTPMPTLFEQVMKQIESGDLTVDEATQMIVDGDIPQAVKTYYVNHMPIAPAKKQSYLGKIWSAITGK